MTESNRFSTMAKARPSAMFSHTQVLHGRTSQPNRWVLRGMIYRFNNTKIRWCAAVPTTLFYSSKRASRHFQASEKHSPPGQNPAFWYWATHLALLIERCCCHS